MRSPDLLVSFLFMALISRRDRHYIEQYFLGLDKLKVKKANNSRTSRTIELLRDSIRTKWGVKLGYFTR